MSQSNVASHHGRHGLGLTVLLDLVAHDALLAGGLIDGQEEARFLVVVVFLYQPMPSESVRDKVMVI